MFFIAIHLYISNSACATARHCPSDYLSASESISHYRYRHAATYGTTSTNHLSIVHLSPPSPITTATMRLYTLIMLPVAAIAVPQLSNMRRSRQGSYDVAVHDVRLPPLYKSPHSTPQHRIPT